MDDCVLQHPVIDGVSEWSLIGAFLKLWGHAKHSPRLMAKTKPEDQS